MRVKGYSLQGISEADASNILFQYSGIGVYSLEYHSWPQTYSNTAGPFNKPGRISGQAFTTFQMECWTDGVYALIFSGGKEVHVVECTSPFTVEWYKDQRKYA